MCIIFVPARAVNVEIRLASRYVILWYLSYFNIFKAVEVFVDCLRWVIELVLEYLLTSFFILIIFSYVYYN